MVANRHSLQPPVMRPQARPEVTRQTVDGLFQTAAFRDVVAERLAGAVRIPTVTYDGMAHVGQDHRWDIFGDFTSYLKRTFPRVHQVLRVETVHRHALLYTWAGADGHLKPLVLMAHSDVVPADVTTTEYARWTHPPFSGLYDGQFVWGRGAEDDKSNLIAMLTAIDCLVAAGFCPCRTLVLAVGFDEEGGAEQSYGARCLAETLLARYGHDGVELIFDEGIAGIEDRFGTVFALPATAEKGYVDVTMTLRVSGGHSSTPPDHTAIGFLAQAIQIIENRPFPSQLARSNPTLAYLRQAALLSKTMPDALRHAILAGRSSPQLLEYMDSDRERRALIRTTTAVDVVHGGQKANSLPEQASVLINHRIAVQDSVQAVTDHYVACLAPWAAKWNLTLHAFDTPGSATPDHDSDPDTVAGPDPSTALAATSGGDLFLRADYELEPSPVSSPDDARFAWLAGTLKHVFGSDVVVAPELLTGNTDTRYYWDLSRHIYRMSPWRASHDPRGTRMHTVDERMPVEGLMEMVHFYHEFIRVVDEARS